MAAPTHVPRFPLLRRMLGVLIRSAIVIALVLAIGVGIGKVLGEAVALIPDPTGGAVTLEQLILQPEPKLALAQQGDLPADWKKSPQPGFGILGLKWCGKDAVLSGAGQPLPPAMWVQDKTNALIISESLQMERHRNAASYLADLNNSLGKCNSFFVEEGGKKVRYDVDVTKARRPITDYLSRTIRPADRSRVEVVSVFQVGNVLVAIHYLGPSLENHELLPELERKILQRVAPEEFPITSTTTKGAQKLPPESTIKPDTKGLQPVDPSAVTVAVGAPTVPTTAAPPPPATVPIVSDTNPPETTGRRSTR